MSEVRGDEAPAARRSVPVFAWVAAAAFLVVFVLLATSTIRLLSADFLPARHLDVGASSFVRIDAGRARLRLTVRDAPSEAELVHALVPGREPGTWVVEIRPGPPGSLAKGKSTRVVEVLTPAVPEITVLDLRWSHPDRHPEGHRFVLAAGEDGTSP